MIPWERHRLRVRWRAPRLGENDFVEAHSVQFRRESGRAMPYGDMSDCCGIVGHVEKFFNLRLE